jgi:hypothetical protein
LWEWVVRFLSVGERRWWREWEWEWERWRQDGYLVRVRRKRKRQWWICEVETEGGRMEARKNAWVLVGGRERWEK